MMRRWSVPYFLLLGFCSIWILLLIAPPLLARLGWGLDSLTYAFFSQICHQRPERSYFWLGHQLAVCHRCLGIYLGFWLGLLVLPFADKWSRLLLSRPRLLVLFFVPLILDVLLENRPESRLLTGALAGFPVALFAWTAAEQLPVSFNSFFRRSHESSSR